MAQYDDHLTLEQARKRYFEIFNLGEGGYTDRWVTVKMGPIPITFPNTKGRIEAVQRHDLHHVATGYDANWVGETEIGAWEVASGCGRFGAAWILNLYAFAVGLVMWPSNVFRSFLRGRRELNLYLAPLPDGILSEKVSEFKKRLRIGIDPSIRPMDYVAFTFWALVALALAAATLAALPLLIWSVIRIF